MWRSSRPYGAMVLASQTVRARSRSATRVAFGVPTPWLITLSALLANCGIAAAQPAPSTLEPVLITGTRVPTTLREGTDNITVVSREALDRMVPATGADLFRQVPGLQIDQLGGPGGLASVYIRGSDPNHVLILIDGVRVNDSTNSRGGGFDLSGLDPGRVERIEILRGAASAIYGADAMGGVINIVTRRASPGLAAGISYGGLGYRSARASGSMGNVVSAGVSTLRDGREADGGALALTQLDGSVKLPSTANGSVVLDLRHSRRESSSFPDDSGGIQLATLRTLERHDGSDTSLGAKGRWEFDAWTLNATASSYRHVDDIVSPGVAPGERNPVGVPSSASRTSFMRTNLLVNGVVHLPGGSELAVGGEYQREHGISQVLYTLFGTAFPVDFDLTRVTRSAFAELKWLAAKDLVVRAGLRHDGVRGNGSHTSPSIGARYDLRAIDASLKASYSEGFKPPSFFVLGLPAALGGNPSLRAERSKGGSIGYEQRFWEGRGVASMSVFQTIYRDLVTYDSLANQTVNAGRVDIRGAEFELSVPIGSSVGSTLAFTRLLTRVGDNGEPLRQRPGRRASMDLIWGIDEASSLDWRVEVVADVFDSSVPTGSLTLPTSIRHDVAYVLRLTPKMRVSATLDNVFDRRNQSYIGQPAPGRRLRLALDAAF